MDAFSIICGSDRDTFNEVKFIIGDDGLMQLNAANFIAICKKTRIYDSMETMPVPDDLDLNEQINDACFAEF